MDADLLTDFAASIRYALTQRTSEHGEVEIVLDLYRGSVPALSRTVARVAPTQAGTLVQTCRRYLERRGAHAVANGSVDLPAPLTGRRALRMQPEPWTAAPVAAFDWMFAG